MPRLPTAQTSRDQDDRGATLLEILVAVVILGAVGVGVLAGLAAAATGASVQRSIASAQSWLATTGDAVAATDAVYVDCDSNSQSSIVSTYQGIVDATRTVDAPTVTVTDVSYWNGSVFTTTCGYAAGDRLQQVELSVDVDGEPLTLSVVKRPLDAPTAGVGALPPGATPWGGTTTIEATPGLDGP